MKFLFYSVWEAFRYVAVLYQRLVVFMKFLFSSVLEAFRYVAFRYQRPCLVVLSWHTYIYIYIYIYILMYIYMCVCGMFVLVLLMALEYRESFKFKVLWSGVDASCYISMAIVALVCSLMYCCIEDTSFSVLLLSNSTEVVNINGN
jgi:hypothetical protein